MKIHRMLLRRRSLSSITRMQEVSRSRAYWWRTSLNVRLRAVLSQFKIITGGKHQGKMKFFSFHSAINNSCHSPESNVKNSPLAWHLLHAHSTRRLLLFLFERDSWISNRWFRHLLASSHLSNPMWKRGKGIIWSPLFQ